MDKKKFSSVRFSWKQLWSTANYVEKVFPSIAKGIISGSEPEMADYLQSSGSKNTLTLDYLILTNSPSITHLFIETKGLFDFLADSPIKDLSFARFASQSWDTSVSTELGEMASHGPVRSIVIHHQYPALPSIKVMFLHSFKGTPRESFYVYVEDGCTFAGFAERVTADTVGPGGDGYTISDLNLPENHDKPMYRYARLAMNLLLYERCFPDKIIDGVPQDIANPNFYRRLTSPHTVSVAQEILHPDGHGKTPHFRSGYFKTLSSVFFRNKRGQVIFVDSTFVKGKAKTVEPVL